MTSIKIFAVAGISFLLTGCGLSTGPVIQTPLIQNVDEICRIEIEDAINEYKELIQREPHTKIFAAPSGTSYTYEYFILEYNENSILIMLSTEPSTEVGYQKAVTVVTMGETMDNEWVVMDIIDHDPDMFKLFFYGSDP